MEKCRVLVHDKKNIFIKMFKKKFNGEFDFIDANNLNDDQSKAQNFDRALIAVYTKSELFKLLDSNTGKHDIIICLFNTQINSDMEFMEEIDNVLLLDVFKTKSEIIKDLQIHLQNRCNSSQQINRLKITTCIYKYEINKILKGVIFLN